MNLSPLRIALAALALISLVFLGTFLLRTNRSDPPADSTAVAINTPGTSNRSAQFSLPPTQAEHPVESMRSPAPVEEIVGIGAMLRTDPQKTIVIQGTVPNSPAAEAGLTRGLIVSKINDVFTKGMRLDQCVELIRGPAGTMVNLELIDPEQNETNQIKLVRKKVVVTPVN